MPYFNQTEVEKLKSTIVCDSLASECKSLAQIIEATLTERLERRMSKRVESGDYRMCAAHDLAPRLEKAFNIRPKVLAKNKEFLKLVELNGLKLKEEQWAGALKNYSPQNRSKHKAGKRR